MSNTKANKTKTILIFTEGTILMHKNAQGLSRAKIVKQVQDREPSVHDYSSYLPIRNAVHKIEGWIKNGAKVCYLTSRRKTDEIEQIQQVLNKNNFPKGQLFYRIDQEEYKDVAERVKPDILIEDDCESIGGKKEWTITYVRPEIKKQIRSIVIPEFDGIDHLQDNF